MGQVSPSIEDCDLVWHLWHSIGLQIKFLEILEDAWMEGLMGEMVASQLQRAVLYNLHSLV